MGDFVFEMNWICHQFCIRLTDISTRGYLNYLNIFHVKRGFAQIKRYVCVNTSLPLVSFPLNNLPYPLFFEYSFTFFCLQYGKKMRLFGIWYPFWVVINFIAYGTQLMSAQFNKLQPFPTKSPSDAAAQHRKMCKISITFMIMIIIIRCVGITSLLACCVPAFWATQQVILCNEDSNWIFDRRIYATATTASQQ